VNDVELRPLSRRRPVSTLGSLDRAPAVACWHDALPLPKQWYGCCSLTRSWLALRLPPDKTVQLMAALLYVPARVQLCVA